MADMGIGSGFAAIKAAFDNMTDLAERAIARCAELETENAELRAELAELRGE